MATTRSIIKILLCTLVTLVLVGYLWWISTERSALRVVPPPSVNASKPVPDFTDFDRVGDKKRAFFAYLKPEIDTQNEYLLGIRHRLEMLRREKTDTSPLSAHDTSFVAKLAEEYRVPLVSNANQKRPLSTVINELLERVDIIPVELVLVQAANESAWGTSRFARKGYNFFGLWCFSKGCGFVPSRRADDAQHEVAKFSNLTSGVYAYLRNLNRHQAYSEMRKIRSQLRANQQPITGDALAEGLLSYSERGQEYVEELQAMIRFNKEYFVQ